ncbi:MAG: hypothetical protein FJ313_05165 [Gemmatimonadetes bacterium]|nr:hypothetical protein [Gemmatimonadota bacterium]
MPEKRRNSPLATGDRQASATESRSVEAVWRQALLLKEILRDEKAIAHKRRNEAEEARRAAERDAIAATEAVCQKMRAEAEEQLEEARAALGEAERIRADAMADAERAGEDAEAELFVAKKVRAEAEEYAARVEANAREKAEAMLAEARKNADQIRDDMRRETADEIRELMEDIEAVRAAAEEELETQRILTEAARIRALSPGLAVTGLREEVEERLGSNGANYPEGDDEAESVVISPVKPESRSSTSKKTVRPERAA